MNSDKKPVSISVFFPCYNEQGNIARTAQRAIDVLQKLGADYEVVIVDDGSSDATAKIADEIAGQNNR
ncbi:MAG: glycosyltransferase, partial [Sedimentisphaerales bacterium]|nr:glycosyltransferase [Sedimentisphaerales bacterium]